MMSRLHSYSSLLPSPTEAFPLAGARTFRPVQPVNRDAMAAFMGRYYTQFGTHADWMGWY
jgi:hypothetical protein